MSPPAAAASRKSNVKPGRQHILVTTNKQGQPEHITQKTLNNTENNKNQNKSSSTQLQHDTAKEMTSTNN